MEKVQYIENCTNEKLFEKSDYSFEFNVGVTQTIKGLDIGVLGM